MLDDLCLATTSIASFLSLSSSLNSGHRFLAAVHRSFHRCPSSRGQPKSAYGKRTACEAHRVSEQAREHACMHGWRGSGRPEAAMRHMGVEVVRRESGRSLPVCTCRKKRVMSVRRQHCLAVAMQRLRSIRHEREREREGKDSRVCCQ